MNPRRPRWFLLLLMLLASWLARQAPQWYRQWQARAGSAAKRKPKTVWPWALPPAPRAHPAAHPARSAPHRRAPAEPDKRPTEKKRKKINGIRNTE